MIRKTIDITKEPTKEQIGMLKKAAQRPVTYDDDSSMLTDGELLEFRRISEINKHNSCQ